MHDQLRKSITALVFALTGLAIGAALGQIPQTPIAFRADAPDRYVVVRGDTLWGISERFTDSPWRWPEIWNFNREQIRNPHWIFPGDVIVLDRASGRLSIAGADGKPGDAAAGAPGDAGAAGAAPGAGTGAGTTRPALGEGGVVGTVKLAPRVRAESTSRDAIPSIPPGAIEPFLSRPLIIEPDGLDQAPTIIATEDNRVIIEAGNRAYVRGMEGAVDENWFVYRRGKALVDPDTSVTLGYEAIYLGTARMTRAGEPATVRLTSVTQEVSKGDKLVPMGVPEVPKYAPHAPAVFMQGRVIGIYGGLGPGVGEAGPMSIITLNRGRADGVEVGHVFALYRPGPVITDKSSAGAKPVTFKVPDERYGLAFVFRLYDRVSYALVMRVSKPVNPLDVVQTP